MNWSFDGLQTFYKLVYMYIKIIIHGLSRNNNYLSIAYSYSNNSMIHVKKFPYLGDILKICSFCCCQDKSY